ncbi:DNA glycosylase [Suillus spraguei]|nr:DNA glycosylase [Suillus spraguei]
MRFAFSGLEFSARAILRFVMPVTRSTTRSVTSTPVGTTTAVSPTAVGKASKRKAAEEPPVAKKTPRAKRTKSSDNNPATPLASDAFIPPPPPPLQNESSRRAWFPQCKPFELLEQVHPFRALVESILAQQISWLAARSIIHRFTRLYDPSLPEKVADYSASRSATSFFPTPYQVANTDIVTLRSAGLSTRKAEYVQDLAARFADERLSTEKLLAADDERLAEMLIEVRGIGRWTVDMFAIFSLRRPNILPVGDLGMQRGMLRWFLSRHSSKHPFIISPHKISDGKPDDDKKKPASTSAMGPPPTTPAPKTTPGSHLTGDVKPDNEALPTPSESQSQTPASINSILALPELFTPSIDKTLEADAMNTEPLPEGLSVANLKSRLEGKKIKYVTLFSCGQFLIKALRRGAFLTPKEMEDLTASWVPYRSLGVYYMWALSEDKK